MSLQHMRQFLCVIGLILGLQVSAEAAVRLKDLGRFDGVRENVAIGYGLVVGLSGTGDSRRSLTTVQSVSNLYGDRKSVV